MMRSSLSVGAVLLAASMAIAQSNAPATQAPGTSTSPPPQSGTGGGAQAQPAAGARRVLQAKSQDELKAYQDATGITDAAQALTAADAFAAKYPTSELRAALYIRAMNLYGQKNNAEKLIEAGRKAIAADPTNPVPLVQVASTLVESTRETDLDREERLNEAAKDAHAAIDNLDTGLIVPPNAPADKVAGAKKSILTMAYDTLGMVEMNKKDYAAAEQDLLKAAEASKANPEAVVYLRLSVVQDHLCKHPQALESANKAVQLAPDGNPEQNLAKQQQARLQKLVAAESPASPATPATPTPPTSGSDIATVAVEPRTLNFINSLGPDIVFFTSRQHPISRLADITADSEFGAWGPGPGPGASIQDLVTLKEMITGKGGNLLMVGNGHFGNLFEESPQLKLFVTFSGIAGVSSIEDNGCGMRVRFVEAR